MCDQTVSGWNHAIVMVIALEEGHRSASLLSAPEIW